MKQTFSHTLLGSFYLWFDHYLLSTGEAFSNETTIFYPSTDASLPGYVTYASPYKQLVYDSSIPGANVLSGVAPINTEQFIGRGTSGLMFDYQNGRIFSNLAVSGELYNYITGSYSGTTPAYVQDCNATYVYSGGQLVSTTGISQGFYYFYNATNLDLTSQTIPAFSGNYAKKEFNTYITSESNQQIVFESIMGNDNNVGLPATGLSPYIYAAPCSVISLSEGDNEPFTFGGQDLTKMSANVMLICKDQYQIDGVLSLLRDTNNLMFPLIPLDYMPLNFYGDIKDNLSGVYNYNNYVAQFGYANNLAWVKKVHVSKVSEKTNNVNNYFVAFVNFDINMQRYPRRSQ